MYIILIISSHCTVSYCMVMCETRIAWKLRAEDCTVLGYVRDEDCLETERIVLYFILHTSRLGLIILKVFSRSELYRERKEEAR